MKICFFIGSRANYGRLKMVIHEAISSQCQVDIILASEGTKINNEYKKNVRMTIDGLMYNDTHCNMIFTTGIIAEHVANYFEQPGNRPDVAIVHGDRYECLGFAMAASYMNIPLAHTEGGELTGTIDNKVRLAITALADYHFTPTELAYKRLSNIYNINPSRVFFVGSPTIDYIKSLRLEMPDDIKDYALVIMHPNTTQKENFDEFIKAIDKLRHKIKIIWISPNTDPGCKGMLKQIHSLKGIQFEKSMPSEKFYTYLWNCNFLLGNSSAGIKEGGFLGIPYLLVGTREDEREHGLNVITIPFSSEIIFRTAMKFVENFTRYPRCTNLWGNGTASEQIINALKEVIK